MKVRKPKTTIHIPENFGENLSYNFSIDEKNMGFIFEILRKKMYKDPIGSICREVATNARDANRESRRARKPITIEISSNVYFEGNKTISFIDEGPGISPNRMKEIFVNFGASTKRTTNKYHGAYGLGAKTPFAYTDNFLIETRVDGTEYIYIAAVEEQKKGGIHLISKKETDKNNGTTITIPINHANINEFESGIIKATLLWSVRPKLINFTKFYPEMTTYINSNYGSIVKDNSESFLHGQTYAVIDGILYPVDTKLIIGKSISPYCPSILLKYPNGKLSISANREALHLDKSTIKYLKTSSEMLLGLFSTFIASEFENTRTYIEACHKFSIYPETLRELINLSPRYKKLYLSSNIKLNKIYLSKVSFDYDNVHRVHRYSYKIKKWEDLFRYTNKDFNKSEKPTLYLMDLAKYTPGRDLTLIQNKKIHIMIFSMSEALHMFPKKKKYSEKKKYAKELHAIRDNLKILSEEFNIIKYSTIAKTNKKATFSNISISRDIDQTCVYTRFVFPDYTGIYPTIKKDTILVSKKDPFGQNHRIRLTRRYARLESKGIYLDKTTDYSDRGHPLNQNKIMYYTKDSISDFSEYKDSLDKFLTKILYKITDRLLFIINKKQEKFFIGVIPKLDDVIKTVSPHIWSDICDCLVYKDNKYGIDILNEFCEFKFPTDNRQINLDAIKIQNKIKKYNRIIKEYELSTRTLIPQSITNFLKPFKKIDINNIKEFREKLYKEYPLLNKLDISFEKKDIKAVNEYISLISNSKKRKQNIINFNPITLTCAKTINN